MMRAVKLGIGWVLTVQGWIWVSIALPESLHSTEQSYRLDVLSLALGLILGVAFTRAGSALRRASRRTVRTERTA